MVNKLIKARHLKKMSEDLVYKTNRFKYFESIMQKNGSNEDIKNKMVWLDEVERIIWYFVW